jgi:peptidoglycan biosynthesis protein MviN/MurJ (putative lipid II flippase)
LLLAAAVGVGETARGVVSAVVLRRRTTGSASAGELPRGRLFATAAPHFVSMVVISVNPIVDRTVASGLAPGSVTLLELGERVLYVPVVAITSSVILVAGARWAKIGLAKPERLRADVVRTLRVVVLISVGAGALVAGVLSVATAVAGRSFQGASPSDFRAIALIFIIGLPGSAVLILSTRFLTAVGETNVLPALAVLLVLVNLGGDLVGAAVLEVKGIALASTVVRYVAAGVYLWILHHLLVSRTPVGAASVRGRA